MARASIDTIIVKIEKMVPSPSLGSEESSLTQCESVSSARPKLGLVGLIKTCPGLGACGWNHGRGGPLGWGRHVTVSVINRYLKCAYSASLRILTSRVDPCPLGCSCFKATRHRLEKWDHAFVAGPGLHAPPLQCRPSTQGLPPIVSSGFTEPLMANHLI